MNIKQRLVGLARRKYPAAANMSADQILNNWQSLKAMNDSFLEEELNKEGGAMDPFIKGFLKTATPLLSEQSYNSDDSEHQQKSQAILEASYDDDKDNQQTHLSKEQKETKKLVKEERPFAAGLNRQYLIERS